MATVKLPTKCLLDTGVLLRGVGWEQSHPEERCADFFRLAQDKGLRLFVPAPALAELGRRDAQARFPILKTFPVVAFGQREALEAATMFPELERFDDSGSRLKFDSMILATARVWSLPLITIDTNMQSRATSHGLAWNRPIDFLDDDSQLSLPATT
ncbi:MAG: PIN domain-containing protein [Myxococcota bacterium]